MHELQAVLDHFLATKAKLAGAATRVNSIDQHAILEAIPKNFEALLAELEPTSDFKVEGSIGNGNIARVPWVGIFHREVTESAQNGYYIVLLFAEDMSGCYLSLNQGVTDMEKRFTRRLAISKMREAARNAFTMLELHPEAHPGPIDLHSTGDLGKGYDAGAIVSFYYPRTAFPTRDTISEHLAALLSNYSYLRKHVGGDLQLLAPVTETEFQEAVYDKAASKDKLELALEPAGGVPKNYSVGESEFRKLRRSASVAALALRKADFRCELGHDHRSFLSRSRKKPYVEAHHLIPLHCHESFPFSLDVSANIVALCPTCHRMLHYAADEERLQPLLSLLERKLTMLQEKGIAIRPAMLRKLYCSRDLIGE